MANLSDMNGLQAPGPQAGPQAVSSAPSAADGLHGRLQSAHAGLRAQFAKSIELLGRADRARKGLEALTGLGDMIGPEDVVREAGKLVAGGEDPLVMAGLLADMPQDGGPQAIQGWVAQHAMQAAQTEAMIQHTHALLGHELGVSALHVLQAHGGGQPVAAPEASPAPSNDLMAPAAAPGVPSDAS